MILKRERRLKGDGVLVVVVVVEVSRWIMIVISRGEGSS
jgi:hypothetical protein